MRAHPAGERDDVGVSIAMPPARTPPRSMLLSRLLLPVRGCDHTQPVKTDPWGDHKQRQACAELTTGVPPRRKTSMLTCSSSASSAPASSSAAEALDCARDNARCSWATSSLTV